jgi:hypothetical protein
MGAEVLGLLDGFGMGLHAIGILSSLNTDTSTLTLLAIDMSVNTFIVILSLLLLHCCHATEDIIQCHLFNASI